MRKLPTHLKLLRGNPGRRAILPEPEPTVPDKLPEPPGFLNEDAVNEWWRVVPELHALGLLTVLDVMPLAAYCAAFAHWIEAERLLSAMAAKDATSGLLVRGQAGSLMVNPLLKIARNAAADMVRFAGEFGMTPVARSHISASPVAGGKFLGLVD